MSWQFLPTNGLRPVDWRWQRACQLADQGRSCQRRYDDHWVSEAVAWKRLVNRGLDEDAEIALAERFPAIFFAHHIREDSLSDRYTIEARLLARQTPQEIAQRIPVAPEVIEAYAAMYFDVGNRLDYPDFIVTRVIGEAIWSGLADRPHDVLWKLWGYFVGPVILDSLIYTMAAPTWLTSTAQVPAFVADDIRLNLQTKAAMGVRGWKTNSFNQGQLVELYLKGVEIEKLSGRGAAHELMTQNILAVVVGMGWGVRSRVDRDKYNHPVENRAEELVGVPCDAEMNDETRALTFIDVAAQPLTDEAE